MDHTLRDRLVAAIYRYGRSIYDYALRDTPAIDGNLAEGDRVLKIHREMLDAQYALDKCLDEVFK